MKMQWKRLGSGLLAAGFLISTLGIGAMAAQSPVEKDETVYAIAGADGSVTETIVSDWLKNTNLEDVLKDSSSLSDIEVVKGDATMSGSGESLSWDTKGGDVYYQGKSTDALPVGVSFTYLLDGKKIAPEDLAGKSGKLTIQIQYTNNEKKTVDVGGTQQTMYVPFLMVTGLLLDSDCISNVEIDHGMVENDGDRTIILGYGLPGLADSLQLSGDFDIPELSDSVTVTADVENFSLDMTLTMASSDLLNDLDVDTDATADELESSLNELEDAAQQLVDGTAELLDGATELADGSVTLKNGAASLADGAANLDTGIGTLKAGAGTLAGYTLSLQDGTSTLKDGIAAAKEGAASLYTGLADAKTGAGALQAGLADLKTSLTGLQQLAQTMSNDLDDAYAAGEKITTARDSAVDELTNSVTALETAKTALLAATPDADTTDLDNAIAGLQTQITALKGLSAPTKDASVSAVQMKVAGGFVGVLDEKGIGALQAGAGQLVGGADELLTGAGALQSGLEDALAGAGTLQAGATSLNAGAQSLAQGIGQAAAGSASLKAGAKTLYDGTESLAEGAAALQSGAETLRDGMEEFQADGIEKLCNLYRDNIPALIDRLTALRDLAKDYGSFSGVPDGAEGHVKFLIRTEGIGTDTTDESK